jgi:hypothetical protein
MRKARLESGIRADALHQFDIRIEDPSSPNPTNTPTYNNSTLPGLTLGQPPGPNAFTDVTLSLAYWVYNPDATLKVIVDPGNRIQECNEENNAKGFGEAE